MIDIDLCLFLKSSPKEDVIIIFMSWIMIGFVIFMEMYNILRFLSGDYLIIVYFCCQTIVSNIFMYLSIQLTLKYIVLCIDFHD